MDRLARHRRARTRCSRRSTKQLAKDKLVPVFLSADEEEHFYGRVCNDTLWPLFHYFGEPAPHHARGVAALRRRERALRRRDPRALRRRTRVWVHDFHLMLVPAMLRRRAPGLAVGFFLHTPFPSSEIYRLLPAREALLRGLLGADYVSFQVGRLRTPLPLLVPARPRHRLAAGLARDRRAPSRDRRRPDRDRRRRLPGGARGPRDRAPSRPARGAVRGAAGSSSGVERLDYTKGIPQKLLAFERFLEQRSRPRPDDDDAAGPRAVAAREPRVSAQQRDEIELLISRINGRFGQPGITPVEYLHRNISKHGARRALPASGRDDGHAASRRDEPRRTRVRALPVGARPSGALARLAAPLRVRGLGPGAARGAAREPLERRRRGGAARNRARARAARSGAAGSRPWPSASRRSTAATLGGRLPHAARAILAARPTAASHRRRSTTRCSSRSSCADSRRARARTIVLDYDGTLREIEAPSRSRRSRRPRSARCSATSPRSRRPTSTSSAAAGVRTSSNGSASFRSISAPSTATSPGSRASAGARWSSSTSSWMRPDRAPPSAGRRRRSRCATSSGSRAASRGTTARRSPSTAPWRAHELLNDLGQQLAGEPAEVLAGPPRRRGARARRRQGRIRPQTCSRTERTRRSFVIGLGDDRTDHDLLDALPSGSVAGHVGGLLPSTPSGGRPRRARPRSSVPGEVRALLRGDDRARARWRFSYAGTAVLRLNAAA